MLGSGREAGSGPAEFGRHLRWLVIGNSGSGKSTLAHRIGNAMHLPVFDLDAIHWEDDGRKRDEAEAMAAVAAIAEDECWIVEGVYGWLAQAAVARANALVWLDLGWDECREGLRTRGSRRGMTANDQEALLAWAEAYWTRTTASSFAGHEALFRSFQGPKVRLRTRRKTTGFLTRRDIGKPAPTV